MSSYLENLQKGLLDNGYKADVISVCKNGIDVEGIRLGGATGICPVIYPSKEDSLQDVVSMAKSAMDHIPDNSLLDMLSDWTYVKQNVRLAVQRRSCDPIFKKDCHNLEMVMRVYMDIEGASASAKVGPSFAKSLGVTEYDLWNAAISNCEGHLCIRSLSDMLGLPEDTNNQLFVAVSDDMKVGGAIALAFPDLFREFCRNKNEDGCYILPSSVEELMVIPLSLAPSDVQELADMVKSINESVVEDRIQLPAVAYRYSPEKGIEIVAEA